MSLLDHVRDLGPRRSEETVYVPAWKQKVLLRGMTARERDAFEAALQRPAERRTGANGKKRGKAEAGGLDLENFRAKLLARCIWEVDADGNESRPFAHKEGEQILGDQPADVIDPMMEVARRLNGMTEKDVEELEGNFDETSDDDSSSVLPLPSDAQSVN